MIVMKIRGYGQLQHQSIAIPGAAQLQVSLFRVISSDQDYSWAWGKASLRFWNRLSVRDPNHFTLLVLLG